MPENYTGRRLTYGLILFFITLSGFAQMPIFDRYYISDIPGLGWLAQFYVTHAMHYIMAALLLALGAYALLDEVLGCKRRPAQLICLNKGTLTATGWIKLVALAGLVVTGCLMVVKNLPQVFFPHYVIIGLDLLHLLFCMGLLGATFYSWIRQKKWVTG